jgi:hypothetical protein
LSWYGELQRIRPPSGSSSAIRCRRWPAGGEERWRLEPAGGWNYTRLRRKDVKIFT